MKRIRAVDNKIDVYGKRTYTLQVTNENFVKLEAYLKALNITYQPIPRIDIVDIVITATTKEIDNIEEFLFQIGA